MRVWKIELNKIYKRGRDVIDRTKKLSSRIDSYLFDSKPDATGLLPNSLKKNKSTGLTRAQFIDIILRNL